MTDNCTLSAMKGDGAGRASGNVRSSRVLRLQSRCVVAPDCGGWGALSPPNN